MALTIQDKDYRSSVQDRISEGVNFRRLRYGGTELSIMPNVTDLGEGQRDRSSDVQGLFFQQYRIWVGAFEQKELPLAATAFRIGENWEYSDDDGATWNGIFILKPVIHRSIWHECIFAEFLADANLTVTYEVGLGTYSTIEGNQVEDTTTAQFTAILNQRQRPRDLNLPGTPASAIYMEGFHISPKAAPTLNKQQRLTATLNGVSGSFIVLPTVQPPTGLNSGSGDILKGFFIEKGL